MITVSLADILIYKNLLLLLPPYGTYNVSYGYPFSFPRYSNSKNIVILDTINHARLVYPFETILTGMDKVSPQTRSRMMAGIRGRETKPERIVRTALFARGFRYRKNCPDLPGKPDIKLTKYNAVILVHGCFWHGHDCRYYRVPASNSVFWSQKIDHNRKRDAHDIVALRGNGWRVCIVWECATRSVAFRDSRSPIIDLLSRWITGSEPFLELYDRKAMHCASYMDRHDTNALGTNTNMDHFVAERTASYDVHNRD